MFRTITSRFLRIRHRYFRPPIFSPPPAPLLALQQLGPTPDPSRSSFLPAVLFMGAVGLFGSAQTALADANEEKVDDVSELEAKAAGVEKLVSEERRKIEEFLKSKGLQRGSYPPFTVAVRGHTVAVKFKVPPTCEVSHLIMDIVSHLGMKAEQHGGGSEMILRAWDSAAAWQLTLSSPEQMEEIGGGDLSNRTDKLEDKFCVLIFESLVGSEYCEVEFIKQGSFSYKELDALASTLKLTGGRDGKRALGKNPKGRNFKVDNKYGSAAPPSSEKSVSALEAMGVRVYGLDDTCGVPMDGLISWDNIAGYEEQKREIEDTILLALQSPEVYDDIARGTRCKFETNRPRAVLFDGPPGTGKTSSARVIAKQAGVPLLYVPLEVIMSKYYGESERLLGTVFSLANDFPNGAIIFLDEVDSFAIARDNEMHEATRRVLSVLLRQIDGFEEDKQVVVIAATNRKQDLDPALISRFDSMISFDLPDLQTRKDIAAQYAKHLKDSELVQFATATEEMSGRDIRDVCQQAERHWASKLIRGQAPKRAEGLNLPPIEEYVKCAEQRRQALVNTSGSTKSSSSWKPMALA